ncbi:MAG: DedA family protein [Bacteroidaceae bacterium]|nr:DedA family protein [Bacteroidaceae bacterium]MBQ3238224.1 DedA family protein [Bacteroidaceae bacterium]MBQ7966600.1 DedA family protein [Bacteroidaceae bacterium]MBR3983458.1 DedA family protein [Bacteroidaceae bacterium]MBR4041963.1 DedA family protein [Bacteroidaceae bacterium]
MEQLLDILINYGPIGMFIAAFLAGSILPFSSETVMIALLAAGVNPWVLLLNAAIGNSIGGITCYCIGRITTPEKVQRLFRIKPQHMARAHQLVERWGAWMGLFCWLPILGDAILVTLGIMRSNPLLTNIAMIIGRTLRYTFVLLSAMGIGKLILN